MKFMKETADRKFSKYAAIENKAKVSRLSEVDFALRMRWQVARFEQPCLDIK